MGRTRGGGGRPDGKARASEFACESHRVHRTAADLAADQENGARVLRLKAIACDQRLLRDPRPGRQERCNAAAGLHDGILELGMFGRVGATEPVTDEGHRREPGRERSPVRSRIDARCEPRDDGLTEREREPIGKLDRLARRSPASDDGDAPLRQAPSNVKFSLHSLVIRPSPFDFARCARFAQDDKR